MHGALTDKKALDATSRNSSRDSNKLGSRAKKKHHAPMGSMASGPSITLPPICQGQPPYSPAFVCKLLSGRTPIPENLLLDRPLSVVELPHLIAQVGLERSVGDAKWMEGPHLMASVLGADIPVSRAAGVMDTEPTAER